MDRADTLIDNVRSGRDGNRVLTLHPDDTWSATPGPHLEVTGTVTRSYFFLGSQRIVMRVEVDGEDDEVYYFHTDHLGSIAAVSHEFGNLYELVDSARYLPFGGRRVEKVQNTHAMKAKLSCSIRIL